MDSSSNNRQPAPALLPASPRIRMHARHARTILALTKPRITLASVMTVAAGYAAAGGVADPGFLHLLGGAALAAAGSLALNQWWERDTDPMMARTRGRPLPQGRLTPAAALAASALWSAAGLAWLALACGTMAAWLGAAIILIYGCLYTPLKRHSRFATEVGAISGALPPLLGAAAAGQPWAPGAWTLAGILLFWQMPHFYAIGWLHRHDYRAAGLPLQPALDHDGRQTATFALSYAMATAAAAIIPWAMGWCGPLYGAVAAAAMGWLLWRAIRWRSARNRDVEARRLFRATLLVLPPVMLALAVEGAARG